MKPADKTRKVVEFFFAVIIPVIFIILMTISTILIVDHLSDRFCLFVSNEMDCKLAKVQICLDAGILTREECIELAD